MFRNFRNNLTFADFYLQNKAYLILQTDWIWLFVTDTLLVSSASSSHRLALKHEDYKWRNGGLWFLSSLIGCYCLFPITMHWASSDLTTNAQLSGAISKTFWFQLGLPLYAVVLEYHVCGER